jgi:hypothetical protein
MQMEQFVSATGAELVGGNLILGVGSDRKVVGTHNENGFALNEAGQALLKELSEPVAVEADEAEVDEKPSKRKLAPPVRAVE